MITALGGSVGGHTILAVGVGVNVGGAETTGERDPTATDGDVGVTVGLGGGEKVGDETGDRGERVAGEGEGRTLAAVHVGDGVGVAASGGDTGIGVDVGVCVAVGLRVGVGLKVDVGLGVDVGVVVGDGVRVGVGVAVAPEQISEKGITGGGSPCPGSPGPQDHPSTSPSCTLYELAPTRE